ncbi:hypothetical protein, partial [Burkholderia stagnalis]|uniref:hypothetical protein n=1 Tax=Burkholderia stagnalis TaxID=1503054 RepID=UPI0016260164
MTESIESIESTDARPPKRARRAAAPSPAPEPAAALPAALPAALAELAPWLTAIDMRLQRQLLHQQQR